MSKRDEPGQTLVRTTSTPMTSAACKVDQCNPAQKLLCGLVVPHEVKAQGSASLAALSALCMYLKRCNANQELATGTHKVVTTYMTSFLCLLRHLMTPNVALLIVTEKHWLLTGCILVLLAAYMCSHFHAAHETGFLLHR